MANNSFQLNYDEMATIAKSFKDEGEDIARLHSDTRQRVRDLYKEWVGEAADKFFEEMETSLLPALQRLSLALFSTQDVSNDLMKIILGADEETASYFKDHLSGDDFGAGKFGEALDGLQGGPGTDDFGTGKFGEAIGSPLGGGSSAPDDFGAAKFGEATSGNDSSPNQPETNQHHDSTSSQDSGQDQSDQHQKEQKEAQSETQPISSGGGGGGGSSSSEGLKGDLKNMGTGLGEVTPQNAESGGGGTGGPTNMPDHVYSSEGTSDSGGVAPQPSPGGGSSNEGQSASGGRGAVAGAAGAAGAAAAGGGAAKARQGKKKKNRGE